MWSFMAVHLAGSPLVCHLLHLTCPHKKHHSA
jgi:hypothetical protein